MSTYRQVVEEDVSHEAAVALREVNLLTLAALHRSDQDPPPLLPNQPDVAPQEDGHKDRGRVRGGEGESTAAALLGRGRRGQRRSEMIAERDGPLV